MDGLSVPPLTAELVRELSKWQLQFYIRRVLNGVPLDGDRYQGTLEYLRLLPAQPQGNLLLKGKFSWLAGSIHHGPWLNASHEFGGKTIPKEPFIFVVKQGCRITMIDGRSCAIRNPRAKVVPVFFAPRNENQLQKRGRRIYENLPEAEEPMLVQPRSTYGKRFLRQLDWDMIQSAFGAHSVNEPVIKDLLNFQRMAPMGVVRITQLFPDLMQLDSTGAEHYAQPMESRLNHFFQMHNLPYKAAVSSEKTEIRDWFLKILALEDDAPSLSPEEVA